MGEGSTVGPSPMDPHLNPIKHTWAPFLLLHFSLLSVTFVDTVFLEFFFQNLQDGF